MFNITRQQYTSALSFPPQLYLAPLPYFFKRICLNLIYIYTKIYLNLICLWLLPPRSEFLLFTSSSLWYLFADNLNFVEVADLLPLKSIILRPLLPRHIFLQISPSVINFCTQLLLNVWPYHGISHFSCILKNNASVLFHDLIIADPICPFYFYVLCRSQFQSFPNTFVPSSSTFAFLNYIKLHGVYYMGIPQTACRRSQRSAPNHVRGTSNQQKHQSS